MPRSLQLGDAPASATTSLTAATSPWKYARRATAQSFSAGDFRHQHDTAVAFEAQLDALVGGVESAGQQLPPSSAAGASATTTTHLQPPYNSSSSIGGSSDMAYAVRGVLERSISSASTASVSVGGGSLGDARAPALRPGAKITGRRHRTPRRFVVTDIPDFDEFSSANAARHVSDEPRRPSSSAQPRPGKMEVKGRFTIIDLSPDSPVGSPRAHPAPLAAASVSEPLSRAQLPRPAPSPRRRVIRKSPSQNSVRLETPTTPSGGAQQPLMYLDPVESSAKARRVDLSIFDRHLDYLQKESDGMKALLNGMVSTNARWISALSDAGVTFSSAPRAPAPPPAVVPVEPDPVPARGASLEDKFAAMELAYLELQKKHEALAARNESLEARNTALEAQLAAQTQTTDDLRLQLRHMSQFAARLASYSEDPDPALECASDRMSVFGDQSSVEVDEPSPSGAELSGGDFEFAFGAARKAALRRRRWFREEEECMSDTSSEGSEPKARAPEDDGDNNADRQASGSSASALDAMLREQARELRASLHDEASAVSVSAGGAEPMLVDTPPRSSNQETHAPDAAFARSDSLSSLLLSNYSTVSSSSSVASVGVQVAAFAKAAAAAALDADPLASPPSNQAPAPSAADAFVPLSRESLLFHDKRASGFALDPHDEDAAPAAAVAAVASDLLFLVDAPLSQHAA